MSHQSSSTAPHLPVDSPRSPRRQPQDARQHQPIDIQSGSIDRARHEAPQHQPTSMNVRPGSSLPEQHQMSPMTTANTTPVRLLGVHNILNPSTEPPASGDSLSARLPSLPPLASSPRGRKRHIPGSPTPTFGGIPSQTRRVLTPKSPSLRAASIGTTTLPSIHAVTNTATQPLLTHSESRIYTAEPGTAGVPALPQYSPPPRAFPPIQPHEDIHPHPQLQSTTAAAPQPTPESALQDRTGLGQWSRQSAAHHEFSPPIRYNPGSGQRPGNPSFLTQFRNDALPRTGSEMYQMGKSSYEMTLETDDGPMVVPVELDLQQASKVADEKRKRNAGASARFRARRKEKEKEASYTINSLKQEMESIRVQRDFYRQERDFMRNFAATHVVSVRLPERPPSPVHIVSILHEPDSPSDAGMSQTETTQHRYADEYHQQNYSPPQSSQAFKQEYDTAQLAQHGLTLPRPSAAQQTGPSYPQPGVSGPPPLGPRSRSSYDPFRHEPFERPWEHGR